MSNDVMIPGFDYANRFNNTVSGRRPPTSAAGTEFVNLQKQKMMAELLRLRAMDSVGLAVEGQERMNDVMGAESTEFLDPLLAAWEMEQNERRPDSASQMARRYPKGK